MIKIESTKWIISLLLLMLCFNLHGQYGIIEMKNGDQFEMATSELRVEKDKLRYFKEKWERKTAVMGIANMKKIRKEYEEKTGLVNVDEIKKIHVQGQITWKDEPIYEISSMKVAKLKKRNELFFVLTEGKCNLLFKWEDGNAWYSLYLDEEGKDLYHLHRGGTGLGAKFRKKSKKYFAECQPAMDYINGDLKRATIPTLVEIYNENCAE